MSVFEMCSMKKWLIWRFSSVKNLLYFSYKCAFFKWILGQPRCGPATHGFFAINQEFNYWKLKKVFTFEIFLKIVFIKKTIFLLNFPRISFRYPKKETALKGKCCMNQIKKSHIHPFKLLTFLEDFSLSENFVFLK